jgi:hypothetical protein
MSNAMAETAYADWRAECEAIHKEMDEVVRSAWLQTEGEREHRRMQYQALIERRDAAARKFLQPKRRGPQSAAVAAPKAPPRAIAENVSVAKASVEKVNVEMINGDKVNVVKTSREAKPAPEDRPMRKRPAERNGVSLPGSAADLGAFLLAEVNSWGKAIRPPAIKQE